MRNYKTTIAGVASILSGVALYINHPEQIEAAIGLVTVGFVGIFGKDHNVTGSGK